MTSSIASMLTEPGFGEAVPAVRLLAIAGGALVAAGLALAVQAWRIGGQRAQVPVRIHVAGTRGKSTTTRMIAEARRAGGCCVYGKTTGSEPRLLLPDGTERRIRRWGRPSIREQGQMIAAAAAGRAEAAVIECMAIRPEMLWASQALLVQAT